MGMQTLMFRLLCNCSQTWKHSVSCSCVTTNSVVTAHFFSSVTGVGQVGYRTWVLTRRGCQNCPSGSLYHGRSILVLSLPKCRGQVVHHCTKQCIWGGGGASGPSGMGCLCPSTWRSFARVGIALHPLGRREGAKRALGLTPRSLAIDCCYLSGAVAAAFFPTLPVGLQWLLPLSVALGGVTVVQAQDSWRRFLAWTHDCSKLELAITLITPLRSQSVTRPLV